MENNNMDSRRGRNGIKLAIIVALCILLLIPWVFIRSLISERSNTTTDAENEVCEKWGTSQTVKGPAIKVYTQKDEQSFSLLPDQLDIKAEVNTRNLNRGIYDFTVYDADIVLSGTFLLPPTLTDAQRALLAQNCWQMAVDLSSLKGLTDNPTVTVGGRTLTPQEISFEGSRLLWRADLSTLVAGAALPFEIRLPLRGSNELKFVPMGNTTSVQMHSNCPTPSFDGNFLPVERTVTSEGFDAQWRVLAINRSFPQVVPKKNWNITLSDSFSVQLRQPVMQYQQNDRASKYAFLVVLLTFAVVFFVEVRRERPIHPVQYLLIGIAVMLFYTLLLSFSEHLSFLASYLIASVMTAGLLGVYLGAIMRDRKVGLVIGGLLAALYAFIYILLQIESYALLVGSVGLFALLAVAMAASRRIDWYNNNKE